MLDSFFAIFSMFFHYLNLQDEKKVTVVDGQNVVTTFQLIFVARFNGVNYNRS